MNFKREVLPFIIATAGEFVALHYWLTLRDGGQEWLAAGLLWGGFLVERLAVVAWLSFVYRRDGGAPEAGEKSPLWKGALVMLGVTLTEILIWVIWVEAIPAVGQLIAGLILLVLMQAEHAVEMAILKRTPLFRYFLNLRTFVFTVVEVVGAMAWIYFTLKGQPLIGALSLLLGLSIEHVLQGSQLRPEKTKATA